jgi:hypothetical protein
MKRAVIEIFIVKNATFLPIMEFSELNSQFMTNKKIIRLIL